MIAFHEKISPDAALIDHVKDFYWYKKKLLLNWDSGDRRLYCFL